MAVSPWSLSKTGTEHGEQSALFCWAGVACTYGMLVACDRRAYEEKGWAASQPPVAIPELKWMFAIPNGGSRGDSKSSAMFQGAMMKAEGVKSGVSDVLLPVPRHNLCGLFIEMKRLDGGTLSAQQKDFGAAMRAAGYGFVCCHGWVEAANVIMQWLYGSSHGYKIGS